MTLTGLSSFLIQIIMFHIHLQQSKQASIQSKPSHICSLRLLFESWEHEHHETWTLLSRSKSMRSPKALIRSLLRCMIHRVVHLAGGEVYSVHVDRPLNRVDPVSREVVSRGIRAETVKKNLPDSSIIFVSGDPHPMTIFFCNPFLSAPAG